MNFRKRYLERNKLIQNMRISNRSGSHCGCVRIFPNNTYEHEKMKFDLIYGLLKRGYDVWSEIIWNNGTRSDIVIFHPVTGISRIIEVLGTETEEECLIKVNKYPEGIPIIMINSLDQINLDNMDI